jgi:hypothetical protein
MDHFILKEMKLLRDDTLYEFAKLKTLPFFPAFITACHKKNL